MKLKPLCYGCKPMIKNLLFYGDGGLKKENIATLSILAIIFLTGFYLRFQALSVVTVFGVGSEEFVIRDFQRAFNIVDNVYITLAGPDLTNGGRCPGPFFYFLLSIPLLFHYSYESLFLFNFFLNILSIGLLFFILKKYLGFYISSLSSILILINFIHIDSVRMPYNPSFLSLFIVLFLWLLFEFAFNGNSKILPLMLLIISLGIQIHYSMVTYYLIPVAIIALFRKKIIKKTYLISIIVLAICFTPFAIYKSQTFGANNIGHKSSIDQPSFQSFKDIKFLFIENTIARVAYGNSTKSPVVFSEKGVKFEKPDSKFLNYTLLTLGVYFLFGFVILKTLREGILSCTKEAVVLLCFYTPALIYELTLKNVEFIHYTYILLIQQSMVISIFIVYLFQYFKSKWARALFASSIFVLIAYLTGETMEETNKIVSSQKTRLDGTYENSKHLLASLMEAMNLTPYDFYHNVYFNSYSPYSLKRLEFAYQGNEEGDKKEVEKSHNCFYIVRNIGDELASVNSSSDKNILQYHHDLFLSDPTIEIGKSRSVTVKNKMVPEISNDFKIYEYRPKQKQSCYANSFNPSVVSKEVMNMLVEANKISDGAGVAAILLSYDEKYDSSTLNYLKGEYIILDINSQMPHKLTLEIKRVDEQYFLKAEILVFSEFSQAKYFIHSLNIFLEDSRNLSPIAYEILPEESLASSVNGSYNQKWVKEIALKPGTVLQRNRFSIESKWSVRGLRKCCRFTNFNEVRLIEGAKKHSLFD